MDTGDLAWMLVSSALVLFMSPGLAMFYGGLVRQKNVLSIIMHVFMCMGLVTLIWVVVGYTIAFGDPIGPGDWKLFGNPSTYYFARGLDVLTPASVAEHVGVSFIYQMMFAIITPALIIGAFAERIKFSGFMLFTALWSIFVYPVVAHWVWGGGFIGEQIGALDFAGGTVVHINAGIAALVMAIVLGPRKGWPQRGMPPHSIVLTALGAGILWFGWFGFNAGSALGANGVALNAFITTQVATGVAVLAWTFTEWVRDGRPTTLGAATGAVAGLVAITPAAGFVGIRGAVIIGLGAGVVCYLAIQLKTRFKYDDSLDVVGVHFVGGLLGALLTGLLVLPVLNDGVGGSLEQLGRQAAGAGIVIVYSLIVSFVIAKIADWTVGLRVEEDDEVVGLDLSQHSESGYIFDEAEAGQVTGLAGIVAEAATASGRGDAGESGGVTRSVDE
ncbi:MAG: ammonium transporter [Acidimicrobiia bacterium]|nr:ammonium transporter [Acidimicrobiia bacterium]